MKIRNIENARERINRTFEYKKEIENKIIELIAGFEDETGVKIDRVFFSRMDTVPISEGTYTDITLNIL